MSDLEFVTIHGHRRAYVLAGPRLGTAPVLLLLHGLACDHTTWDPVIGQLAETYTVIAPDLLGHGLSDKPRADYTVAGYANGMRDLITLLGVSKVTVVGHSFGGGVAMQFAYQFPERTERLMLVDPGGLGREVTAFIRAISLPGWQHVLAGLTLPGVRQVNVAALRALAHLPGAQTRDIAEIAAIVESWRDPRARRAIVHLVRAVIDWRGQIISMRDRAYLTEEMPVYVVWGAQDHVVPASHAGVAARLAPHARVTVMDDAGHFPHKDHPAAFVQLMQEWMAATEPASYSRARWRRLLRSGGHVPPITAVPRASTA
ncbi:alpha/beta fold hydrolase [Nocardioides insulae]|uniref:alpha/beta fold hydrolase n=1 Tax=Nocardioides insulae TaxID=394734 RepID=UPI000424297E|nr:alpha/beta fold hydrolase [Nocardioides insulae]